MSLTTKRLSLFYMFSLGVIIICRFHLTLKGRGQSSNESSSSTPHTLTSFRAATARFHNAVVAEFEDTYWRQSLSTETSEEMKHQGKQQMTTEAVLELQEYPWATGYMEDIETSGSVAQVRSEFLEKNGGADVDDARAIVTE